MIINFQIRDSQRLDKFIPLDFFYRIILQDTRI